MSTAAPPTTAPGKEGAAGHFTVLYFASASSHAGRDSEVLPAPMPLSRLFAALEARHAGFRDRVLSSCLVTVNLNYVDVPPDDDGDDDNNNKNNATASAVPPVTTMIKEGDEVAIIPPVSSG